MVSRAAFRILLKGGQNSCFRIPGGASATCCTLQYIYIVKFQGGGKHPARGGRGGRMPKKNPGEYTMNNKTLGRALDPRANGTWLSKLTK